MCSRNGGTNWPGCKRTKAINGCQRRSPILIHGLGLPRWEVDLLLVNRFSRDRFRRGRTSSTPYNETLAERILIYATLLVSIAQNGTTESQRSLPRVEAGRDSGSDATAARFLFVLPFRLVSVSSSALKVLAGKSDRGEGRCVRSPRIHFSRGIDVSQNVCNMCIYVHNYDPCPRTYGSRIKY